MADFENLPQHVQDALLREDAGLTITFNTKLAPVDRFLIDGLIYATLGRHTDCRIVEYRERGDIAVVRLNASRSEEMEMVADTIYHRIWEMHESSQRAAIARVVSSLAASQTISVNAPVGTQIIVQGGAQFSSHSNLGPIVERLGNLQQVIGGSLSELVDRVERIELRLPMAGAAVSINERTQSEEQVGVVRTWNPSDHPHTALSRLVASLCSPAELNSLLPQGLRRMELSADQSIAPTSHVIASSVIASLLSHGFVDEAFFRRLVEAHPEREADIWQVARLWGCIQPEGASRPTKV